MFVVMAFVNPNPGKEGEMASRMRSFRNALQTQSGLVKTFVLQERDGKTLVGGLCGRTRPRTRARRRVCKRRPKVRLQI